MLRVAVLLLLLLGCSRPQAAPAAPTTPVIPGMESGDLRVNLENRGLTCVGPQPFEGWVTWECRGSKGGARYQVLMRGVDPTRIFTIDATVLQGAPDDVVAAEFLGYVATISYEGARPAEARSWVQGSIAAESARKAFGGAMFALSGPPENRSLTITPTTLP